MTIVGFGHAAMALLMSLLNLEPQIVLQPLGIGTIIAVGSLIWMVTGWVVVVRHDG